MNNDTTDLSQMAFDMIIIGAGAAGLTSALTAAVAGHSVLVIEKTRFVGGATARSEGMAWVPCSRQADAAGIKDHPSDALEYLRAASPAVDPNRAHRYAHEAAQMLAFVEDHSPVDYELVPSSIDYYDTLPGALLGGRALRPLPMNGGVLGDDFKFLRSPLASTMIFGGMTVASRDLPDYLAMRRSPRSTVRVVGLFLRYLFDRARGHSRGRRIAGGNALIAGLWSGLRSHGGTIMTESEVISLNYDGNRVQGVEIIVDGKRQTLTAQRGVLLATGGFSWNEKARKDHYPHGHLEDRHTSLTPAESATGDGLNIALEVGASINRSPLNAAAWSPVSRLPQKDGTYSPFPHYIDRAKPGIIAIDDRGKRFINEAVPYQDFTAKMIDMLKERNHARFYLVCDSKAIRRYGLGAAPPSPGNRRPFVRNGYLLKAPTLQGLAERLCVDPNALDESAMKMTIATRTGVDEEFGKGSSRYDQSNGDASKAGSRRCLGEIETGPFYAVEIGPGDIATFVGIDTDSSARVLREDGSVIAGLYAAGSDMATVAGGAYPAAGITIGPAMTFGWIAAREMIGNSNANQTRLH